MTIYLYDIDGPKPQHNPIEGITPVHVVHDTNILTEAICLLTREGKSTRYLNLSIDVKHIHSWKMYQLNHAMLLNNNFRQHINQDEQINVDLTGCDLSQQGIRINFFKHDLLLNLSHTILHKTVIWSYDYEYDNVLLKHACGINTKISYNFINTHKHVFEGSVFIDPVIIDYDKEDDGTRYYMNTTMDEPFIYYTKKFDIKYKGSRIRLS